MVTARFVFAALFFTGVVSLPYPITTNYTENGDRWNIMVIGDVMVASPLTYHYESASGVPVAITETVLSCDGERNVFYE